MSNVHPIHKLLKQHRKCKVWCDVSKLGSIAVQTGKLPVCRPGIVPGQKYSPATECVVLVGRIGAGAASPACLVSPAGRRSPNYTIVPPSSCLYNISQPQFVFISHHLHMYSLPLHSTQKIGPLVKSSFGSLTTGGDHQR